MKRSRKMQVGIGTVLLLTACVAGYLSAYRFGVVELLACRDKSVSTQSYQVADLLSGGSARLAKDLLEVQRLIEATTAGEWDLHALKIQSYPEAKSLIITQTGTGHAKIQKLLADLRAHLRVVSLRPE